MTEKWNGQNWSLVSSPNPGNLTNGLNAAAALLSGQVWAVGFDSNLINGQPGPNQSLILSRTSGSPSGAVLVAASSDQSVGPAVPSSLPSPNGEGVHPLSAQPGLSTIVSSSILGTDKTLGNRGATTPAFANAKPILDVLFSNFAEGGLNASSA
jgi:hypothetical protein